MLKLNSMGSRSSVGEVTILGRNTMVSINGDSPTSMVFVREHPFKMDDLGVITPILGNPHQNPRYPHFGKRLQKLWNIAMKQLNHRTKCSFPGSPFLGYPPLVSKHHVGVSENVVYPIVPNGFADHYPYEKWLFHWED